MTARRDFLKTTVLGTAGVALGATARSQTRVPGANDRVVVASIGIRGQGNALKRGFARLSGVEIKTLCDVDENLFASRANDPKLADVPTFHPRYEKDLRRVFDDKDVDAVVIATPNHWHALATIWAIQAGKHVFVEKPCSHNVAEGRRMVEAARKYNKIVQVGTMNRSRPAVQDAIRFLHEGGLGKVYLARGLCFKPRPSIGRFPDGPLSQGERYRLNVESKEYEPTWDSAYLAKVDYDLWLGPAAARPFNRNRFHYNWHWHWDTGNGDTGNQGPHQFDIARWGLGMATHPLRISSSGGLYETGETSQETPNVQTALFEYEDGRVLEFATRGTATNAEGGQRIGNLFYGTKGWLFIDGDGRDWQSYLGRSEEKGPGSAGSAASHGGSGSDPLTPTSIESPHYRNFIDAVRAGDHKKLNCDIEEGHISSALPHLANIAYRVGRSLRFDGKTETFPGEAEANRLLTREYRAGFKVPDKI
ncbi:MAG TPA: Gfo/Idh/MocA family oxidoreductase [Vicinamibacteria bacterium]|jgi:predicted dehydrogenase|nr:Gfo/Idh/MocA family oxidoreductase [Vicinamibacteria bacterium]